jgi:hypothetical protein
MTYAIGILGAAAAFYLLSVTAPIGPSIMSLVWTGLGTVCLLAVLWEAAKSVLVVTGRMSKKSRSDEYMEEVDED